MNTSAPDVSPLVVKRLLRWARNGMRGLVCDHDAEVVALALEILLERMRETRP
jgi:hypothetical protein